MPTCSNCHCHFRTLPGEESDHECPACGWAPWMVSGANSDEVDESKEDEE